MLTGIAITTEIQSIIWMLESNRYPAEPRYIGEFETYSGSEFGFVSDVRPFEKAMVVGRLIDGDDGQAIFITESFPTIEHE